MHHSDRHAALHQAVGSFETQQTAANDNRMLVFLGRIDHGLCIGNVAVCQNTVEFPPRNGQHEGVRARRQNQSVVRSRAFFAGRSFGIDDAFDTIDFCDGPTRVQGDAVLAVPTQGIENDFVELLFARQNGRQQNTVVVGMRFTTKYGDVVEVGCEFDQLFQGADTGHAVAHHD